MSNPPVRAQNAVAGFAGVGKPKQSPIVRGPSRMSHVGINLSRWDFDSQGVFPNCGGLAVFRIEGADMDTERYSHEDSKDKQGLVILVWVRG